jgi:chemotaxis-related protein WspD
MVFRLGAEWFALRTQVCVEVASMRPIHSLPHRRNGAVLGLASVRGELVVCISLAVIMGLERRLPAVGPQRLLEIGWKEGAVALPVDEVNGVHRFRAEDFTPTPATVSQAQARYTQALVASGNRTIGFLDDERLRDAINRNLA